MNKKSVDKTGYWLDDLYEYIKENIPYASLLDQLAEELGEMQHHVIKAARAYREDNPTPASVDEEMEKVYEEYGDVLNLIRILNLRCYPFEMREKMIRWQDRIIEAREAAEQ